DRDATARPRSRKVPPPLQIIFIRRPDDPPGIVPAATLLSSDEAARRYVDARRGIAPPSNNPTGRLASVESQRNVVSYIPLPHAGTRRRTGLNASGFFGFSAC